MHVCTPVIGWLKLRISVFLISDNFLTKKKKISFLISVPCRVRRFTAPHFVFPVYSVCFSVISLSTYLCCCRSADLFQAMFGSHFLMSPLNGIVSLTCNVTPSIMSSSYLISSHSYCIFVSFPFLLPCLFLMVYSLVLH